MKNIDKLNALLEQLNLPKHRSVVQLNGSNHGWIRKHVDRAELCDEGKRLVDMNLCKLAEDYKPLS